MKLPQKALVVFLTILTTACTPIWQQRPEITPENLWQARHSELMQFDQWQLQGRTAIVQGKEGWNAGLHWQETHGQYQIKILGPFAQGGISLDGDEHQVVLTMNDGQQLSSSSPEALIKQVLNVQLPVSALRDWVRGMPYSEKNIDLIEWDIDGQISQLSQDGWQIEFVRYVPFKQYTLPSKIFIKHSDLSLRLVMTRWKTIQ